MSTEKYLNLMQETLDSLHRSGSIDAKIKADRNTVLMGEGSSLDSIGFVTFVSEFEEKLQKTTGKEVYLVLNDIGDFKVDNPNVTAGVLADYALSVCSPEV